jgi:hypothetical protein
MKALLVLCLSFLAVFAWVKEAPSAASVVKGEVLEVKNSGGYTYLRMKTGAGEKWAAVNRSVVKIGAQVSIGNPMVMYDFESRSLNKTFPEIVFGNLAATGGAKADGGWEMVTHQSGKPQPTDSAIQVPKATGANAFTVEEIVTRAKTLKDKVVVVRGKVVKFNPQIMGKNWVHVRDGSGSAAAESDDLLVTTQAAVKAGEIVTVKGVVRTHKDFGAGYAYEVLIDEATLQP